MSRGEGENTIAPRRYRSAKIGLVHEARALAMSLLGDYYESDYGSHNFVFN